MIAWSSAEPFPRLTIHFAATSRGVCTVALHTTDAAFAASLTRQYPGEAAERTSANPLIIDTQIQLQKYFARELTAFDIALDLRGTAFQVRVWNELLRIPYGTVRSYGEVAAAIGCKSARAVGTANGRNPVAIIVPCHRVIGNDGALRGYGGGVEWKRLLLALERGKQPLDALEERGPVLQNHFDFQIVDRDGS